MNRLKSQKLNKKLGRKEKNEKKKKRGEGNKKPMP